MSAFRTLAQLRTGRSRVERVTTDAVEDRLAPLEFESAMIPPVVKEPQGEKDHAHEDAVNHNPSGEIEHREMVGD